MPLALSNTETAALAALGEDLQPEVVPAVQQGPAAVTAGLQADTGRRWPWLQGGEAGIEQGALHLLWGELGSPHTELGGGRVEEWVEEDQHWHHRRRKGRWRTQGQSI